MAERRMFAKKVTEDDNFMALSSSAQALYLHLAMSADDDGFSNQVSISMFKAHASVQDLEALLEKRYIYQFENGVIVIKHWRMANALRKDRYTPTAFQEELARLQLKDNGAYTWLPDGCQTVAERLPQVSIGKDSIEKVSIVQESIGEDKAVDTATPAPKKEQKHKYGEYQHVLLTDTDRERLVNDYGEDATHKAIKYLDEYLETSGKKYKNHYLVMRKWVFDAVKQHATKPNNNRSVMDEWANA